MSKLRSHLKYALANFGNYQKHLNCEYQNKRIETLIAKVQNCQKVETAEYSKRKLVSLFQTVNEYT